MKTTVVLCTSWKLLMLIFAEIAGKIPVYLSDLVQAGRKQDWKTFQSARPRKNKHKHQWSIPVQWKGSWYKKQYKNVAFVICFLTEVSNWKQSSDWNGRYYFIFWFWCIMPRAKWISDPWVLIVIIGKCILKDNSLLLCLL